MLATYLIAMVNIYLHNLQTKTTQEIKLYSNMDSINFSGAGDNGGDDASRKFATTGGHNSENVGNVLDSDGKYIFA